jgi:hypothetical protein
MKKAINIGIGAVLLALSFGSTASFAEDRDHQVRRCDLGSFGDKIKHVVYIQFDNIHLRRDNPNVPSDLEQMPNLLNFLKSEGTLFTNHHTPLISHTSVDIITSLTGVYGDKFGVPIGNSIGLFGTNGVATFPSSFTYWTDTLSDGLPEMLDQRGKNAPAPWVPFTRAGCDVGAFSIANIEFENVKGDIDAAFGEGSPVDTAVDAELASSNPAVQAKPVADFEGIAIHCAKASRLCANHAAPDLLPDEPGGYNGFTALYGNVNVQPQISPGGPVKDLDGVIIADSFGNPGFPGFDPTASQTLGYLATMLEAGVPVVYGYIEDAHDNHATGNAFGPGEAGYVAQLKAFNEAFGDFFARLGKDGITKENALFIITADENDHFAGGPPSPANCDGVNVPCTYSQIGEIDAAIDSVLFTEFGDATPFRVHSDDAPTFYINGNPSQTDPKTRKLEVEAGMAIGFDVIEGGNNQIAKALAGQSEQALLHMITADPNRTPNFILFANPDYFFFTSGKTPPPTCTPASDAASCFTEGAGFAWNHGDFQPEITHTWLGMVGPGVLEQGETGDLFTDHTDIRPTIIRLVGLRDDYAHDGRVLFEALTSEAAGHGLRAHRDMLSDLASAYKAINAPVGDLGLRTLTGISTTALQGNDVQYAQLDAQIKTITAKRNEIAAKMIEMLEDAAFDDHPIDEAAAAHLIKEANDLLASVP